LSRCNETEQRERPVLERGDVQRRARGNADLMKEDCQAVLTKIAHLGGCVKRKHLGKVGQGHMRTNGNERDGCLDRAHEEETQTHLIDENEDGYDGRQHGIWLNHRHAKQNCRSIPATVA
jgi:hypothetical protein